MQQILNLLKLIIVLVWAELCPVQPKLVVPYYYHDTHYAIYHHIVTTHTPSNYHCGGWMSNEDVPGSMAFLGLYMGVISEFLY